MKTRLIPILALAAATCPAISAFADLEQRDSSAFDYKYEMVSLPTAEDLDDSGTKDFAGGGAWLTAGTGSSLGSASMVISTGSEALKADATVGNAGDVWRVMNATAGASGTGYTIEVRLKVTESTGSKGALVLNASTGDSSVNSWLVFKYGKLSWGHNKNVADIADIDDEWHTYRLVREPGTTVHSVWMDGNLLGDNFSSGIDANINRLLLGAANADYKGKAQVAWLRFTKGAYAPLPADYEPPRKASVDFPVRYEMNSDDTRFAGSGNPETSGTDWTAYVGANPTVSLNSILSMEPNGKNTAYWVSKDAIWKSVVDSAMPYTVEFRARINSCNIDGIDRTLNFLIGTSGGPVANFFIGTNSVEWSVSDSMGHNIVLDENDNSDQMHIFRI